jgi:hypothetical protein
MDNVLIALLRVAPTRPLTAIIWSDAHREGLTRVARGEQTGFSVVDRDLAPLLLKCSDGDFAEAEIGIIDNLKQNLDSCLQDGEIFISLLFALFVVQRLDLVAAMLRDRFNFPRELELSITRHGHGRGQVSWTILPSGTHRFMFDAVAFESDNTRTEILAFQWGFPVYANYARQEFQEIGTVIINQQDVGRTPGLAWCENRPDFFLIPDCIFVPTGGYSYARTVLRENARPWQDRAPIAMWRGATTGIPAGPGQWRSLERIRLCELAQRHSHTGLIDAGISSIIQFDDQEVVKEIRVSGLLRDAIPWQNWGQYKYLVDIDGNSSPWSNLFQKFLTGSTVLKVESSRGLQQWFYDELVPWGNYVPIAPDMSDLMAKISWLERNDEVAQRIGQEGLALAERLTYEREIGRSVSVIESAFRYFNGRPEGVGPFGRTLCDKKST